MIRTVYTSEIDRTNLSRLKTTENKDERKTNHAGVVVQKPWGYEYLMFENDFVAIWILHLKKNHNTSMHCHPRKKTSLIVLSGKVLTSTLTEWFELEPLHGIILDSGVFHSTKALSNNTFIMEIESPPNKKDLVRLKDSYGREHEAYEGKNQHSKELSKFNYVSFSTKDIHRQTKKKLGKAQIYFRFCNTNLLEQEFASEINLEKTKIYSIIEDKIIDLDHKLMFSPGSIFNAEHMKGRKNIRLYNNCLLLTLEKSGGRR